MCTEKCKVNFGMSTIEVRESKQVEVDRSCAGFLAINKGDVVASVNQLPLLPSLTAGQSGEHFSIDANQNELYTGSIIVSFESTAGNPLVVIVQKYYKS